jgi:hypothetical protein
LAWSFNRDGEARPGLVEGRDKRMDIDTAGKRRQREDLRVLARPRAGVDDLKAAFPKAVADPGRHRQSGRPTAALQGDTRAIRVPWRGALQSRGALCVK